ncbi:MAG TPA: LON peptidase substrate-binding domain-containing protein [Acidimicrobiales bacterium]|jgi:Lon protease-like protein|nr:LON peptidase substrate-binding domain-containing protein [Acidimicrobiales bacterium]
MELPMFPLGMVLFPSLFLPLHVFEPRYRVLARHCMDGNREFGVVLIERGSEVGGDDVRTSVGTVAQIIDATELDDGRWVLGTVGTRRVRVREWLTDDPYPRADVDDWADVESADGPEVDLMPAYDNVRALLRRVLALKSELVEPAVDATIALSDDPALGSYQAAAVAPLGPADQQELLTVPGPGERLLRLGDLLSEEETFLRARLRME